MSETEVFSASEDYQTKVISYMLHNPEFKDVAKSALKDEDFANKQLQWYFDTIAQAEIGITVPLLKEELLRAAKEKKIKDTEITKFVELFDVIKHRPLMEEEEYIRKDLSRFIKTQAMKRAILDSFDQIEKGDWDGILDKVTRATQAGIDIMDTGQDYFKDFAERLFRRIDSDGGSKLSTGILELDQMLNGGLKKKQLGIVAGGTGRGKSIFLEWLARVAVLMGETVVYYTLELPEDEVGARFDSMLAKVKFNELIPNNREVFERLEEMSVKFNGKLIIKEYPADHATVNTIKSHLVQLSGIGIRPSLIIVDYLDLLKPHRSYNSMYEELDAITKALHGLAKLNDLRIWTATQLNRAGITMESPDETAMSGSLAKLFTVDVAIFLAQTKEEREEDVMRLIVSKNRNGVTGRTIKIDTDYSYMTFYKSTVQPGVLDE